MNSCSLVWASYCSFPWQICPFEESVGDVFLLFSLVLTPFCPKEEAIESALIYPKKTSLDFGRNTHVMPLNNVTDKVKHRYFTQGLQELPLNFFFFVPVSSTDKVSCHRAKDLDSNIAYTKNQLVS